LKGLDSDNAVSAKKKKRRERCNLSLALQLSAISEYAIPPRVAADVNHLKHKKKVFIYIEWSNLAYDLKLLLFGSCSRSH